MGHKMQFVLNLLTWARGAFSPTTTGHNRGYGWRGGLLHRTPCCSSLKNSTVICHYWCVWLSYTRDAVMPQVELHFLPWGHDNVDTRPVTWSTNRFNSSHNGMRRIKHNARKELFFHLDLSAIQALNLEPCNGIWALSVSQMGSWQL